MPPALATHGLTKSYGSLTALEPLDIELEPGVVLGFLGPNGAGKTTLIRMVTTIVRPTAGSFEVAAIPHTRPNEIRRRIGVLPESAGYPDGQTGEEYLTYYGRLYGLSRAHARTTAGRLLEEVRLDDRSRSLVSSYSRGMRQRLGIARALVNEPQVVFLDEPTLGLDPSGQRQVLGLVSRIARERGATVLLSTHLLAEVEEICDRVLIVHRGRVVAHGTVEDVAARAAAPRSAQVRVPAEQSDLAREALAAAGVPVIEVEVERGRLSDAFLEMTETR